MSLGGHIVVRKSYAAGFMTAMCMNYHKTVSETSVLTFTMLNDFINSCKIEHNLKHCDDKKLIRHIFTEIFGELITLYTKDGTLVYCALGDYDYYDAALETQMKIECLFWGEFGWEVMKQDAMDLRKSRPAKPSAPKPKKQPIVIPDEPEPEEEKPDYVRKVEVDGKKYLRSEKTGCCYDYQAYVKEGEQVFVGKWNGTTIDFISHI